MIAILKRIVGLFRKSGGEAPPPDSFAGLGLLGDILQAIEDEGYQVPTPIQLAAIPKVMAGRDLMATAQTGSGKTAAFSLPILHHLSSTPGSGSGGLRALVLTPTRELALQIEQSFCDYGRHLPLFCAVILGGVPQGSQVKALQQKPEILVATPGRLLDLHNQGHVVLEEIEVFVLDEADRMLDMGFIRDVRRIIGLLPKERQTLLFSATISSGVARLASGMLRNPEKVEVAPSATVPEEIAQKVMFVSQRSKHDLLVHMLKNEDIGRALIFTRTKIKADGVMDHLRRNGVRAQAIHSNKTQGARQQALYSFDKGKTRVLVATDIMSRGIDVEGITHVINYEVPEDAENYVHRIGRTARAGALGTALTFCDAGEINSLGHIEKLIKKDLDPLTDHPFHSESVGALHRRINVTMEPAPKPEPKRQFGRSANTSVRKRSYRR